MKLRQLLDYNNIVVQCHNTPDADAIASGMAVLSYLRDAGKNACFIYGGNFEITKRNLKLMVEDLHVDIKYVRHQVQLSHLLGIPEHELPGLLITVDSQYGEGNIRQFKAKEIAVIDHHQIANALPVMSEVRSYLASCSTLLWDMLREEGYSVNDNVDLSTALYYGLMTDSSNFSEIHHPLDMDMRDNLKYSTSIINKFKNSNISQEELRIAGIALLGSEYYKDNHYSIVKTDPCDPNVLGIISDMVIEVEDVECCLAYTIHEGAIKFSVRSCVREVKADELAKFISAGVGNGGGHKIKAGGSIIRTLLEKQELEYQASAIHEFFRERMNEYFLDTEIIYIDDYSLDISKMKPYVSKGITIGYLKAGDALPVGTTATIRAIDGDIDLTVEEDTIISLGIRGEVNVIDEGTFKIYYEQSDEEYIYPGDYAPVIRGHHDGKNIGLLPLVKSAAYVGSGAIYASELKLRTKLFTKQLPDDYCLGRPGDYIIYSNNPEPKIYICAREQFVKTYRLAK